MKNNVDVIEHSDSFGTHQHVFEPCTGSYRGFILERCTDNHTAVLADRDAKMWQGDYS